MTITHTTTSSTGLVGTRERLWAALTARDETAAAQAVFDAHDAGATKEDLLLDVIGPVQARVGGEWAMRPHRRRAGARGDRDPGPRHRRPRPPGPEPPHRRRAGRPAGDRDGTAARHRRLRRRRVARAARPPIRRSPAQPGLRRRLPGGSRPHPSPDRASAPDRRGRRRSLGLPAAPAPDGPRRCHRRPGHRPSRPRRRSRLRTRRPVRRPDRRGRMGTRRPRRRLPPDRRPAAPEAPPRDPSRELPHLSDQEYTLVTRSRTQLTRHVLEKLEDAVPAMAAYTEQQRERTAEDIAHIVDFLAASLYADDPELFTGFVTWTMRHPAGPWCPGRRPGRRARTPRRRTVRLPRARTHLVAGRRALARVPVPTAPGPHS